MNIIEQLKRDEGEFKAAGRHVAYQDSENYWTLGFGRLVDARRGGGISDNEADYLLTNDVNRVMHELEQLLPWWRKLDTVRQAALTNMAFQLGITGLFNFHKTLSLVEQGDYTEAAREALRSKWATQTPNRAARVAQQLETGEWV